MTFRPRKPDAGIKWPRWTYAGSDRDQVNDLCYQSELSSELFKKEVSALIAANQMLYLFENRSLAIKAAKDFISYREERYNLIKDVQVPVNDDKGSVSCLLAEAEWEMVEGVANYVGASIPYELGYINALQFIEYARLTFDESAYYSFGQLELFLLKGLFPDEFSQFTEQLAGSESWENNLYSLFKEKFN